MPSHRSIPVTAAAIVFTLPLLALACSDGSEETIGQGTEARPPETFSTPVDSNEPKPEHAVVTFDPRADADRASGTSNPPPAPSPTPTPTPTPTPSSDPGPPPSQACSITKDANDFFVIRGRRARPRRISESASVASAATTSVGAWAPMTRRSSRRSTISRSANAADANPDQLLAKAARKIPIAHRAHTGDTVFPIAKVKADWQKTSSAGFPLETSEVAGGHDGTGEDWSGWLLGKSAAWTAP